MVESTITAKQSVRQMLDEGIISIEELMDLASEELDHIEAGVRFADTTTWIAVLDFAERVLRKSDKSLPEATSPRSPGAGRP